MSMITGEVAPTSGTCRLASFDISRSRKEYFSVMGYCPQFDALFELLTGEECLEFYASVKGIPCDEVRGVLIDAFARMDLELYRQKLIKTYSGGNKRKLSLCVAFIGSPRVVLLGECNASLVLPRAAKKVS